jgi:hypothetical protein
MILKIKFTGSSWGDKFGKTQQIEVTQIKEESGALWTVGKYTGYEIELSEEPVKKANEEIPTFSIKSLFGQEIKTIEFK